MLSPANAEFARRENALPGLATLLDPEAMRDRMRALRAEVTDVRPIYIRHKSGANSLVLYRVEVEGCCVYAHARTFGEASRAKLEKGHRRADAVFEDINAEFSWFPNDPDLPALADLAAPETRAALVARVLKRRQDLGSGSLHDLAYKPLRRYVARLDVDGTPRATLKFHAEAGFQTALAATRAKLRSEGALRLPEPIGTSKGLRAIAYAWIPGAALPDLLTTNGPGAAKRVGAALALLHRQSGKRLPVVDRKAEFARLHQQLDAIDTLRPDLTAQARNVVSRIEAGLATVEAAPGATHGDFSAKQVLITDGHVAIIDLDEAYCGDPVFDLGMFQANLELDALRGDLTPDAVAPIGAAFLEGYAEDRPILAHVRVYTACGLMRLAVEPFRTLTPDWPNQIAALIARADTLLEARG